MIRNVFLQPFRDDTDVVLGRVWTHRPRQLRVSGHQEFHTLLGYADVRNVFGHQHRRPAQPTHRHDEPLVPAHFRKFCKSPHSMCVAVVSVCPF